ncbi:MAG: diacylglycerol kinase family protein [Ramlibacter sp.]
MSGPITVIVNSTAGTGCPPEWVDELKQQFAANGLDARIERVRSGADIVDTVKRAVAGGASTVVAGGGDGTVSAVAAALVGGKVALGVLPMGTLNHFAKDLGIPLERDAAVANIATGRLQAVDAGDVNGRTFINNSSLGLYPDIVQGREKLQRRLGHGKWRALLHASIAAARRYPVMTARIELEGKVWERRTPFVFVGNNEYTMEGFQIGERPSVSGGLLSLYVAQRTGRFGLLRLAMLALFKRLQQARDFDIATATEFVVHTRHKRLRVATDGEVTVMETPLRYRVRPGALRVIVPQRETGK